MRKAIRLAFIVLAISQALPAHGLSLPSDFTLDCTGRAVDRRGRTTAYHQSFFVSWDKRRFCVGRCSEVYTLAAWEGTSIDLSRQSRPMPPDSDAIDLNGYAARETFDTRTSMLSGREISNGGTHRDLTVRARCRVDYDIFPVTMYLGNIPARDVIPAPVNNLP